MKDFLMQILEDIAEQVQRLDGLGFRLSLAGPGMCISAIAYTPLSIKETSQKSQHTAITLLLKRLLVAARPGFEPRYSGRTKEK